MLRVIAAFGLLVLLLYQFRGGVPVRADEPTELDAGTAALIDLLPKLEDAAAQADILKGIRQGLRGKRRVVPPSNWREIYREHLARSESAEVRQLASLLALQFGDKAVREQLLGVVSDKTAPLARRREALAALAEIRAAELPNVLHRLLGGSDLRPDALRVLAEIGGPESTAEIIRAYPDFGLEEKRIAIDALSSGVHSAKTLLKAVEEQKISRTDLNAETIRRLKLLGDDAIDAAIAAHWGTVRETPEAKAQRIAELKQLLTAPVEQGADLPRGRALFAKTCRQCHTLYDDGEKVGPEITGSNRGDLDYLLVNVVDPNSTVGKDYQAWSVMTDAGKLYVGLVAGENNQVVTLRTETDTVHIPKDEIDYRELTTASMMPEGLFDQLSERDLRDLVAYLRGSRQVPMLATTGTASQFFNRQDLSHWRPFGGSWRVEDATLHGTIEAAASDEAVLISDLVVDEGVVEMEVKLTAGRGSAAIALVPWTGEDLADRDDLPRPRLEIGLESDGAITLPLALIDSDTAPPARSVSSKDRHMVRIARSADRFTLAVDGHELLSGKADAMPRFRVAFVLQPELAGELVIRNLNLAVPQPPADAE